MIPIIASRYRGSGQVETHLVFSAGEHNYKVFRWGITTWVEIEQVRLSPYGHYWSLAPWLPESFHLHHGSSNLFGYLLGSPFPIKRDWSMCRERRVSINIPFGHSCWLNHLLTQGDGVTHILFVCYLLPSFAAWPKSDNSRDVERLETVEREVLLLMTMTMMRSKSKFSWQQPPNVVECEVCDDDDVVCEWKGEKGSERRTSIGISRRSHRRIIRTGRDGPGENGMEWARLSCHVPLVPDFWRFDFQRVTELSTALWFRLDSMNERSQV